MSKKRKHEEAEEPENHERWLITYADMITLLMAFFIMLFAMSQIDLAKFRAFQGGVASRFKKPGAVVGGGQGLLAGTPAESQRIPKEAVELLSDKRKREAAAKAEHKTLVKAQKQIHGALAAKGLGTSARFAIDERGLVITIVSDKVLFDPGSADLRPGGSRVLDVVAGQIARLPNHVSIDGHTDNRPISSARFPSNWELSTGRASTVVRYLSGHFAIRPTRLTAAGYADQRPAVPNTTERNRQRNRRVEIVVIATSGPPA